MKAQERHLGLLVPSEKQTTTVESAAPTTGGQINGSGGCECTAVKKMLLLMKVLSGYWQVPFAPESREITALSTPNGTLNGCVCPLVLNLLLSPSRG